MRFPRLRLTVRGLMLVVFGLALGVGADMAYNRFNLCMDRAAHYEARREKLLERATAVETNIDKHLTIDHKLVKLNRLWPLIRSSRIEAALAYRSGAAKAESLRSQALRAAYLPFVRVPHDPAFDQPMVIEIEPPPVIPDSKSTAGR